MVIQKRFFSVLIALLFVLAIFSLFISGCKKNPCPKGQFMFNDHCCPDKNFNFVCDDAEGLVCGDGICHETENCSTCWQDCGACKITRIIKVPSNFSLLDVTKEFRPLYKQSLNPKKDLEARNNVSDFFYYDEKIPRYMADFFGIQYNPLIDSRMIVFSKIKLPQWYLNHSGALLDFVNASRWYFIDDIRIRENRKYLQRIIDNKAIDDYPTPPTGYQKQFRYKGWLAVNYSVDESVIYDNITALDDDMIWGVYGSISDIEIKYRYNDYTDKDADDKEFTIYAYRNYSEIKLNYINTITFTCARNLAVTLYDYSWDMEHHNIKEENMRTEVEDGKRRLLTQARSLKALCDKEYKHSIFVPDGTRTA